MIGEVVEAEAVDRTAVWRIAAGALGFRVLSSVLALFVNLTFPPYQPISSTVWAQPSPFWDGFARYDSGWYYQVARYGYAFVVGGPSVGVGKPGKIAYFPLYPLLMRYTGRLFGTSAAAVYIGGIVVSWCAFIVAMLVLYKLARLDLSGPRAERAVLLTAIFPFGFFFGLIYTEALFLCLTVIAFYLFRTRRYISGGIVGGLVTATRVNGILMLPALAWIAWREGESTTASRTRALAGLVLVTTGIALYSAYVYRLAGNPFEWAVSISRWNYHPGGAPWLAPVNLIGTLVTHPYRYLTTDPMAPYDVLYGVTAILFVIAIPFVWVRLGAAYGLFMLLNLYLPLSSGAFEGLGRYCSILFPCFIWLASLKGRWAGTPLVVVFATLYTLGLALFTTVHPLF